MGVGLISSVRCAFIAIGKIKEFIEPKPHLVFVLVHELPVSLLVQAKIY